MKCPVNEIINKKLISSIFPYTLSNEFTKVIKLLDTISMRQVEVVESVAVGSKSQISFSLQVNRSQI